MKKDYFRLLYAYYRRSLEIQGTALSKNLWAWTCIICIYRSMPAGVAQSRHAFVGVQ